MILFPNAKINLGLNVMNKRIDGFHDIETVFYPINTLDILEILPQQDDEINSFTSCGIPIDCSFDNNLILKAHSLLKKSYPNLPSIRVFLEKRIPIGSGLGGGSSDASFTLKYLNDEFNLNIPNNKLEEFASELGADCAFFIHNKPQFASGIGDKLTSIDLNLSNYYIALVCPNIHISTVNAFKHIIPTIPKESILSIIKKPIEVWKDFLKNDFEVGIFKQYPIIKEIKQELYDKGAIYASMSGSGSSVYGIFNSEINFNSPHFTWCDKLTYND